MLRYICREIRPVCYCSIVPFSKWKDPHDDIDRPQKTFSKAEFERIVAVFQLDSRGYYRKEYAATLKITIASTIIGCFYGVITKMQEAHDQYLAANQQTKYLSAYEARRKLNDYILLKSVNGLRYGAMFGMMTGIYSFTIILIAAYRNENGILEFFTGGFLAGAFARYYLGWKATFAGGAVGGMMGAFVGALRYLNERRAYVSEEPQKAQKESSVRKEVLLVKQKIAHLKNYLVYRIYDKDKVLVITNSDSADTDSSSNTVMNSTDKAEFPNNINKQNAEP